MIEYRKTENAFRTEFYRVSENGITAITVEKNGNCDYKNYNPPAEPLYFKKSLPCEKSEFVNALDNLLRLRK